MKNKKWLIWLIVLVVVLLAGYFTAGYFLGNVPIASKLLGTNKPRDLGVKLNYPAAAQGLVDLKKPLSPADVSAILSNPKGYTTVKTSLTQDEASSLLAIGDIPNYPFRVTQIKFGANGKVQASGELDTVKLQAALKDIGASADAVDKIMSYLKGGTSFPFYLEGTFSMTNNRPSSQIDSLQIGRINIPTDWVKNNSGSIADNVTARLQANGYNIRSLTITEGKVNLDMDRPVSSVGPWLKMVEYK